MIFVAHIGGMPIEETIGMGAPALLTAVGAAASKLHARLRTRRAGVGVASRDMDGLPHVRPQGRAYGGGTVNSGSMEES
jgi:hypothetical protein